MADEMIRVTRPGGTVILSYTLWWGPFGGHEMGLSHYLGGHRAAARYTCRHGHPPKNLYGESLFAVTAAQGWPGGGRRAGARLVGAFPRYVPRALWWVLRVPGLREVAATNLVMVLGGLPRGWKGRRPRQRGAHHIPLKIRFRQRA